jgi:branched-chain amino acid transport system substrate-binding protein
VVRRTRVLAGVGTLAVVLAACAPGQAATTPTDPRNSLGTEEGSGIELMVDLGEVVVAPGQAIQVRSLEAISGPVALLGLPNQRATKIAIEDHGPIHGFDVDLGTPLDDRCSSDGGEQAARQIIADDQVVGVVGTSCSGAAIPASELIGGAGMAMISASNTDPELTQNPFGTVGINATEGYFRTAPNDLRQGAAVASFARHELGVTRLAAIHDGDPYTQGLARAISNAFTELGGEIVLVPAVNKGDTDMVPVLTEVAEAGPEAVYFPVFPPETNRIAEQATEVPGLADVILLSADGGLTESFLAIPESEGLYFSGPNLRFEGNRNAITDVTVTAFLDDYEQRFGERPTSPFWAYAYDAATLLLRAIDEVAVIEEDGSLRIDRQGLRDEISRITFEGMTGRIGCDPHGDCGSGMIQVAHHTDSSVTDPMQVPVVYRAAPS